MIIGIAVRENGMLSRIYHEETLNLGDLAYMLIIIIETWFILCSGLLMLLILICLRLPFKIAKKIQSINGMHWHLLTILAWNQFRYNRVKRSLWRSNALKTTFWKRNPILSMVKVVKRKNSRRFLVKNMTGTSKEVKLTKMVLDHIEANFHSFCILYADQKPINSGQ